MAGELLDMTKLAGGPCMLNITKRSVTSSTWNIEFSKQCHHSNVRPSITLPQRKSRHNHQPPTMLRNNSSVHQPLPISKRHVTSQETLDGSSDNVNNMIHGTEISQTPNWRPSMDHLIRFEEVPHYLKYPYITKGYRCQMSFSQCLKR